MDANAENNLRLQLQILRAQSGDEAAFRALFDAFKGVTFKFLSSLVDDSDIDDLQQQTWFKAYQQLRKLTNPYGFKQWLMQIAHRTALDHFRRRKLVLAEDVNPEELDELLSESDLTMDLTFEKLYQGLKTLPLLQREVVILYYWQEFSCIEIGQILSCSAGTVKSRLFNARKQLQRMDLT